MVCNLPVVCVVHLLQQYLRASPGQGSLSGLLADGYQIPRTGSGKIGGADLIDIGG